jgi:hypothetical protein
MLMAEVFELSPEVSTMCGFCLTKATHFIVVNYSYGKLIPACPEHAARKMY